jgi:hypothetical protein
MIEALSLPVRHATKALIIAAEGCERVGFRKSRPTPQMYAIRGGRWRLARLEEPVPGLASGRLHPEVIEG